MGSSPEAVPIRLQLRSRLAGNEPLILGAIVLAGAVVRFATLDAQSFHHDEAVTANEVIRPALVDTFEQVREGERNPPGYYAAAWLWSQAFGLGEVGLRSLSALFGTLAIPVGYLIGRESRSRAAAIFLAAFVALNPLLVWYSQEARSYELFVLAATGGLLFFLRSLTEAGRRALVLWAGFSALALLSHYFAIFLILPQAAYLLHSRRAEIARVGTAIAAVGLVGLALAPLAAGQQGEDRRDGFRDTALPARVAETGLDFVAGDEPDPFSGGRGVDAVQAAAATGGALLFALGAYLAVTRTSGRQRHAVTAIAIVAGMAAALPVLAAAVGIADVLRPRNMIGLLVPVLAIMAIGFGARNAGRTGALGALLTAGLFATVLVAANAAGEMQRADWRGVASEIESAAPAEPYLVVMSANGDNPLELYLDGNELLPGSRGLRARGVRVRTIFTVSAFSRAGRPDGFQVTRRSRLPPFNLRELRSTRPRLIKPGDVLDGEVLQGRSALVYVP